MYEPKPPLWDTSATGPGWGSGAVGRQGEVGHHPAEEVHVADAVRPVDPDAAVPGDGADSSCSAWPSGPGLGEARGDDDGPADPA